MPDAGADRSQAAAPTPVERTVAALVDWAAAALRAYGITSAVSDARELVSALYDVPRFWPVANAHQIVTDDVWARAVVALDRRLHGAPLAYAVGRAAFRHMTLAVDERVLIPRPETEQLVDLVLDAMREVNGDGGIAVDVGTGSGAIALALATEGSFDAVYATDISADALAVARANAQAMHESLKAPVEFLQGSLLAPLPRRSVRVVVSNPPYIALGEAGGLPASVRDWEPAVALYGGMDGMQPTAQLVRDAAAVLEPGGLLALEVDVRRAALVAERVSADVRYAQVLVLLDLTGRERFVLARRSSRRGGGGGE
jgi:release factor glutamine methyltransferase